ncbi:MAG: GNAT family N-acetyltransferase [Patescibacteria group bacterium]|nr:GNAT family N-acetyltransferase [Patescibacteria group bacterium]
MRNERLKNENNPGYDFGDAAPADAERIWEIRNDPEARRRSNSQEVIPLEKHLPWFNDKYFSESGNRCFVLRDDKDGRAIGYCRFDKSGHDYAVSIALDSRYQGKGLGNLLLRDGLEGMNGVPGDILAEIQKDNAPSLKIFQKNNFEIYKEDDANYYLRHRK